MNIDDKVFFAVCAALAVLAVLYDLYSESRAEDEGQLLPQMSLTVCVIVVAVVMCSLLYLSALLMGYFHGVPT